MEMKPQVGGMPITLREAKAKAAEAKAAAEPAPNAQQQADQQQQKEALARLNAAEAENLVSRLFGAGLTVFSERERSSAWAN